MLEAGIKNRKCLSVGQAETAKSMRSGTLPVLATPAMIALMEETAAESVEALLDEGVTSVGTHIAVSHFHGSDLLPASAAASDLHRIPQESYLPLPLLHPMLLFGSSSHPHL